MTADYSQQKILAILQQYIACKKAKMPATTHEELRLRQECKLPFESIEGLCSGLVAYWLYCNRIGAEQKYIKLLNAVLAWDADAFEQSRLMQDPILEEFLNIIAFLQFDPRLRPGVGHGNIGAGLALLLDKDDLRPQVAEPEFKINFVFSETVLAGLLRKIMHENKMLRVDNIFHAVGCILQDKKYHYIDPLAKTGPITFTSIKQLAAAIFKSFTPFSGSKKGLALNITIADLMNVPTPDYPSVADLYATWFHDRSVKKTVLANPYILRLGLRFDDMVLLNLLFARGYVYIPWIHNRTPELNELVIAEDEVKLRYAIVHGVPVNYRVQELNGSTPLGMAIMHDKPYMMYLLLLAGADPKIDQVQGMSAIKLAISFHMTAAIILLLARDAKLKKDENDLLHALYTVSEVRLMQQHAKDLHERLFKRGNRSFVIPKEMRRAKNMIFSASVDDTDLSAIGANYRAVILPLLTL
jgi:hypothetical protein